MKKFKKRYIVLGVLLLLLLVLLSLAIWQRENIKALEYYTKYTKEELEKQLQQNDQAIKDAVNAVPEVTIRDVTDEEREALKEGTLTQEELKDLILGRDEPESEGPEASNMEIVPDEPDTPAPSKQPEAKPQQSEYEKQLSDLVAQVYVLREEYLIALDELYEEAKSAYFSEKRTASKLADMVSSYMAKGTALEKECDRRMDSIVSQMKKLIKENSGDLTLVDKVIETYAEEKRLKKAWYMSKLEERGLI